MPNSAPTDRSFQPRIEKAGLMLAIGYFICVSAFSAYFAYAVIQDFRNPIIGSTGDDSQWGYQAYYLLENLRLFPYPQLDLINDTTFYPYGTNQVFQPWGLEREYLVALCNLLWGYGPWLQIYFFLTGLVIAVGAFLLLRKDEGSLRAAWISFALAFASYYVIWNFPWKLLASCPHWTTLSLIVDYILVKRFWLHQVWTARLLMLRLTLLVLVLGQELTYTAGYALTTFVVSVVFVTVTFWIRSGKRWPFTTRLLSRWWAVLRTSARRHRAQMIFLSAILLTTSFLYVPLVLQIYSNVKLFGEVDSPARWAHPLRLVIPILPGFNPKSPGIDPCDWVTQIPQVFNDDAEYTFGNSVGAFFLVIGLLGLACAYRRGILLVFVPSITVLLLCLLYHSTYLPTLRMFPWHGFARVTSRATMVYPTFFALFSLGLPLALTRGRSGRLLIVAGGTLFVTEMVVAYMTALTRPHHYLTPGEDFHRFMQVVRESPGEAVLDWPFHIYAGNAMNWPFEAYAPLHNIFSYRQFHTKKIVGMYFGRIHPKQVRPFYEARWDKLFLPAKTHRDSPAGHTEGQVRDFTADEWDFFTEAYQFNDFCGLILYPDLLPAETVQEFHKRFGSPVCTVVDGLPTRMEFIPRKPEWRGLVDRDKARALSFVSKYHPGERIDLTQPSLYLRGGWYTAETECTWSSAKASLAFKLERVQPLLMRMRAYTLGGQEVLVRLNGHNVGTLSTVAGAYQLLELAFPSEFLEKSNSVTLEVPMATKPGDRILGLAVAWIEFMALPRETEPSN